MFNFSNIRQIKATNSTSVTRSSSFTSVVRHAATVTSYSQCLTAGIGRCRHGHCCQLAAEICNTEAYNVRLIPYISNVKSIILITSVLFVILTVCCMSASLIINFILLN